MFKCVWLWCLKVFEGVWRCLSFFNKGQKLLFGSKWSEGTVSLGRKWFLPLKKGQKVLFNLDPRAVSNCCRRKSGSSAKRRWHVTCRPTYHQWWWTKNDGIEVFLKLFCHYRLFVLFHFELIFRLKTLFSRSLLFATIIRSTTRYLPLPSHYSLSSPH